MQKIMAENNQPAYTLRQPFFCFLKLGLAGLGGPVALVANLHRDLFEQFKRISEEEYKEGLGF